MYKLNMAVKIFAEIVNFTTTTEMAYLKNFLLQYLINAPEIF